MKYFLQLLLRYLPKAEGEGDAGTDIGDGDSGGDGGDGGSGDPAGDPKPMGGSDPEGKPDWAADKFWNPDTKEVRTEVLHKSFSELEGKFREKTEKLKEEIVAEMRANAPEKYEFNISDEIEVPDNIDLNFNEEDPLAQWFFSFAKEQGLSQETVDQAINQYVEIELKNMPDVAAEVEKLGDHGQDRMLRVHNWLESKLTEDEFAALNPLLSSAAQVEALEKLMKTSGPADFDGDNSTPALTLEELRAMQNDERYWKQQDKAFIKKVEDGYARLYKGQ